MEWSIRSGPRWLRSNIQGKESVTVTFGYSRPVADPGGITQVLWQLSGWPARVTKVVMECESRRKAPDISKEP